MTSSPTWPVTGRPVSSQASAATPSERAWISPARTGRVGPPPTNPQQQSVPPGAGGPPAAGGRWGVVLHVLVEPRGDRRGDRRAGRHDPGQGPEVDGFLR